MKITGKSETERCQLTELIKTQCAHCKGIEDDTKDDELEKLSIALVVLPGWIISNYSGKCGECYEPFEKGTAIKWTEGKIGLTIKTYWRAACCATNKEKQEARYRV